MSRTTSHGQRGIAMDNSGATFISDDAAGHDFGVVTVSPRLERAPLMLTRLVTGASLEPSTEFVLAP